MTIPHDPLLGVRVKVDRAKKHLADLDTEIREYHARNPYAIIPEIEAETGDEVHRLLIREAIPAHWGAILGDVVHNLRSSLDLLAAELEPYAGGNDPLWLLHEIDNRDKHRLLVPVGGCL